MPDPLQFLITGDPHVGGYAVRAGHPSPDEIRRTQAWLARDLAELHAAAPASEFIVMLGDLTENGSPEELASYREVVDASPIPVRSIFGGHDGKNLMRAREQDRLRSYAEIVGPPWYRFDHRRVRFVAVVSEHGYLNTEQRAAQAEWLRATLEATPRCYCARLARARSSAL